jgi:hemoglobin-like flavoprotein
MIQNLNHTGCVGPAVHRLQQHLKHVPSISKSENIDMARSMTLKAMQQFAADVLTDDVLKAIDADLAKLPAKK